MLRRLSRNKKFVIILAIFLVVFSLSLFIVIEFKNSKQNTDISELIQPQDSRPEEVKTLDEVYIAYNKAEYTAVMSRSISLFSQNNISNYDKYNAASFCIDAAIKSGVTDEKEVCYKEAISRISSIPGEQTQKELRANIDSLYAGNGFLSPEGNNDDLQ